MRRHVLTRFAPTAHGTLGRFERWCVLEEEWRDNLRNVSCIPAAIYVCKRRMYYKGGYETFEITDVPNRSDVLWHAGVTEEHTAGCVLTGKTFGVFKVDRPEDGEAGPAYKIGVVSSRDAHRDFMRFFEGVDEWELEIRDHAA